MIAKFDFDEKFISNILNNIKVFQKHEFTIIERSYSWKNSIYCNFNFYGKSRWSGNDYLVGFKQDTPLDVIYGKLFEKFTREAVNYKIRVMNNVLTRLSKRLNKKHY